MEPDYFSPEEVLDVIVQELHPNKSEYVELFQLLGVYAYSMKNKILEVFSLSGIPFGDPKTRITINGTNVAVFFEENLFNEDQKILLNLLGVTFLEKGKSFIMFSNPQLNASYVSVEDEDDDGYLYRRASVKISITRDRGIPEKATLRNGDSINKMLNSLSRLTDNPFTRDLSVRFYSELERRRLLDAHTALSKILPEDSLVTESLPTQTLYQMMEEDRARAYRNRQKEL